MEVTNCRSCGRLFNVLSNETICPNCQKKLDDKFKEVKEFLDENPNATVEKVENQYVQVNIVISVRQRWQIPL